MMNLCDGGGAIWSFIEKIYIYFENEVHISMSP